MNSPDIPGGQAVVSRSTFRLTAEGFSASDGTCSPYLNVPGAAEHHEWQLKQAASMAQYLSDLEIVPPETQTLYQLFDGFIAATLFGRSGIKVLDVGCGLGRRWPAYVSTLRRHHAGSGILYAGLDPIPHALDQREYPFICGRIEDLGKVLTDRFDAFLFATSLDHFEDIGEVARAVRGLASAGASAIFWVGLHDAALVGEHTGAYAYRRMFSSLALPRFGLHYLRNVASIPITYLRLLRRQLRLKQGAALDKLHFHYFTESSIETALQAFGTPIERVLVPGGSMFAAVRVPADSPRSANITP